MTYDPDPFRYPSSNPSGNELPPELDQYSAGVAYLVGALLVAAIGASIYMFTG